jgi:toxin ParE1/3/4
MARIVLAPEALADLERFFDRLASFPVADPPARVAEIVAAIQILSHSPLIGRLVTGGKREMVIGRGAHGCVALYRFIASIETVFVLAFRHQPKLGYKTDH